ncbi:MAG: hypothetical protein CM1200mP39_08870 [Dehalococcoidia bacterium]|nr:MAG: hypothetical protein CM1200mP39_08870 [Dehalococcoidia bacterium]
MVGSNFGYLFIIRFPMNDKLETKSIPSNEDVARAALDEASEKLGSDIVLLDTRGISSFTDFFVIITGETDRHIESWLKI